MTNPVFVQETFHGRNDDYGINVDNGWFGSLGDDWEQDVDVTFRIRVVVQETNNKGVNNKIYTLYYEKNGDNNPDGSSPVTTASSNVKLVNDSQGIADHETTTQVIGDGSQGVDVRSPIHFLVGQCLFGRHV